MMEIRQRSIFNLTEMTKESPRILSRKYEKDISDFQVFILKKRPGNLSLSETIIMFYIADKATVLPN